MPTLSQLRYIVSVADRGHFGRAAEECHVSQPSLSMQIQKAEEELNLVIFDRHQKPVVPTSKGQKIVQQARLVLLSHQKLLQIGSEESQALQGEFRLSVIPTMAPYVLPLFLAHFSAHYPKVDLYIYEMTTEECVDTIKRGQTDAAILATPLHEANIIETPIFYEPFYVYTSKDHPFYNQKTVSVDDLDTHHEVWLLEDGHCFGNQILKLCSINRDVSVFKNVHFQSGNLETLRNLIRATKGYTLLPHLLVSGLPAKEKKERVRPFSGRLPAREVSLVSHKGLWKSDILEALHHSLKKSRPQDLPEQKDTQLQIVGID